MNQNQINQVKGVLENVQRLLERPSRWGKGAYAARVGDDYCYCLAGAVRQVTTTERVRDLVLHRLSKVIHHRFSDRTTKYSFDDSLSHVVSFNDNTRTSYKNVMSVIRQALNFRTEGGV